eukprot:Opistho-2@30026
MSGRNFQVATRHDIGPQADAYRIIVPVFFAEFFKVAQAVNIHIHPQRYGFFYFTKSDAITGIQHILFVKTCMQGHFHFVDRAAVYMTAQRFDMLEDIDIG